MIYLDDPLCFSSSFRRPDWGSTSYWSRHCRTYSRQGREDIFDFIWFSCFSHGLGYQQKLRFLEISFCCGSNLFQFNVLFRKETLSRNWIQSYMDCDGRISYLKEIGMKMRFSVFYLWDADCSGLFVLIRSSYSYHLWDFGKKSWVLKFLICYDLEFFQFSGPVRVSNEIPFNQSVLHLTIAFLLVVTILVGKGRRTDCKGGQREKSAEVARGRIEIKERRREGYVDLF